MMDCHAKLKNLARTLALPHRVSISKIRQNLSRADKHRPPFASNDHMKLELVQLSPLLSRCNHMCQGFSLKHRKS